MRTEKQIKIVKRAERNNSQAVLVDKTRTNVRNNLQETTRDPVTVIREWVSELRRKKSEEATKGFEGLFGR